MQKIRKGICDVGWNAFMVRGAKFSRNDIPDCPTTAPTSPSSIITYDEALKIYRRELKNHNHDFHNEAFVGFFEDDQDFDSTKGIWYRSQYAADVLEHFGGIIAPDFSTYQDFPKPLKQWNYYRMNAFGHWYGVILGRYVVSLVRWGTPETYDYCFDGKPKNSMLLVSTVGGNPRKLCNRTRFEQGLREMVKRLTPHTILVYGSDKLPVFDELRRQGINIIAYPSRLNKVFGGERV